MLIALLIAGIGFLLAGLLGIAFGIPIKEFSFGNTEILAGVIAACTGMIILSLWIVARQLKEIAQLLGSGVATTVLPQPAATSAPRDRTTENDGLLFNQPGASHPADAEPAQPPPATPPWYEETAARDRVRSDMPPVPPALPTPEAATAARPKRNLLFSSTSRRERERAEGRAADPSMADPPSAPAGAPPSVQPNEPPATFDDAWPQPERTRTPDIPPRRSGRMQSTFAEEAAAADRHPPMPQNDEPPAVTVLKSGVVDGMAYSLYSDGSIEAQMPEGMMRFASIDELRAHLDQRT
jgi:hypothetical protein